MRSRSFRFITQWFRFGGGHGACIACARTRFLQLLLRRVTKLKRKIPNCFERFFLPRRFRLVFVITRTQPPRRRPRSRRWPATCPAARSCRVSTRRWRTNRRRCRTCSRRRRRRPCRPCRWTVTWTRGACRSAAPTTGGRCRSTRAPFTPACSRRRRPCRNTGANRHWAYRPRGIRASGPPRPRRLTTPVCTPASPALIEPAYRHCCTYACVRPATGFCAETTGNNFQHGLWSDVRILLCFRF